MVGSTSETAELKLSCMWKAHTSDLQRDESKRRVPQEHIREAMPLCLAVRARPQSPAGLPSGAVGNVFILICTDLVTGEVQLLWVILKSSSEGCLFQPGL